MYNRKMWFEELTQPAMTTGLSGMGLAGGLVVYQGNGQASVYGSISQALGDALATASKVTDQNGTPVTMVQLPNNGGWLANGCPLNVWFGQGWLPGQQDALRAMGNTQCLPAAPLTQGTVPQAVTTLPTVQAPAFTTTLVTGGIVNEPALPAPVQTIFGPSGGVPSPTVPVDTGISPGAPAVSQDNTLLYVALAIGAILLLRG